MEVSIERPESGKAVVRPVGKVDAESSPDLRTQLQAMADEGLGVVVVDLSSVDFLDSSGLSALVSGLKALRARGGELRLCGARPQALTALRLTMLHRVFPIYADVAGAMQGV